MKLPKTTKSFLYTYNFIEEALIFCFLFLVVMNCNAQYYPNRIGESNPNTININHSNGTTLQDIKRSAILFIILKDGKPFESCTGTLLNNVNQNQLPIISSASHCIESIQAGQIAEGYFSSDFEIENATRRGSKTTDIEISRVFKSEFEVLVNNKNADQLLIQLKNFDPNLFENAYVSGWDNKLYKDIYSGISHPKTDHKKVSINPSSVNTIFNMNTPYSNAFEEVYQYYIGNEWNGMEIPYEKGSSGSGLFSKFNLLKAIFTNGGKFSIGKHIINSWFDFSEEKNSFRKYIDPNATWLNYIPGGYFNELIPVNEDFSLELLPNSAVSTLSFTSDSATKLAENVIIMETESLLDFKRLKKTTIFDENQQLIWTKMSGIKHNLINNSDIVLSLWLLDKDKDTNIYTERLIYGVHADRNSLYNQPAEYGFKGDGWDCKSPGIYPECNRYPFYKFFTKKTGKSNEFKIGYLESIKKSMKNDNFLSFSKSKIPVKIKLENRGDTPAIIQAVACPGEVPQNALQLFRPDEVLSKLKSKKYRPSRGNSTENLYINSFELKQDDELIRKLETGNNGGYLNLVNNNFKFKTITPSFKTSLGHDKKKRFTFAIKVKNNTSVPIVYYKIWIDYSSTTDIDHYYNFEEESHNGSLIELIASGSTNFSWIEGSYTLPYNTELNLAPGQSKTYRLRIAVSNTNNISQDGIYDHGEVEDYWISFSVPESKYIISNAAIHIEVAAETENDATCNFPIDETDSDTNNLNINVADVNIPSSCNDFVCASTDCKKTALSPTAVGGNYSICITGENDYIALDQEKTILNSNFSNRTVSFWLNNATDTGIEEIYDEGGSSDGGMGIRINNETGQTELGVRLGTLLKTVTAPTLSTGSWVHLVGVFDKGRLSLYQNGILSAEIEDVGFSEVPSSQDSAAFGGTNETNIFNSNDKSYHGCADEIMIFQESLNPQQVLELYNAYGTGTSVRVAAKQQTMDTNPLVVFPNPTKGEINIIIELKEASNIELKIIDLAGKEVVSKEYKQVGDGHQLIQLENLNLKPGMYIVKLITNTGEQTEKIVVE